jgi:hypothetical protein
MIVNALQEGWEILYQRSHAILAAELIAPWQTKERPKRWTEILAAVVQHDDQENFWQGAGHLSDLGTPLNFDKVSLDTGKIQARSVIDNARRQSLMVALMISRHNSFLYDEKRGEDEELDQFLDEQIVHRKAWLKILEMSAEAMEYAYRFVGWGDRLSLILCQRQLPDKERVLEICEGPDGIHHTVMQRQDGTISLSPWCYEVDRVKFSAETRLLQQAQFKDTDEFREKLEAAPIILREWEFVR